MTIQTSTLDKLKNLEALYRQGYQSDIIDRALEKLIALESGRIRRELDGLRADLSIFEQEHQMSSEDFHTRFHAGELGDAPDFFEWSALYDMAKFLRNRLKSLGRDAG